MGYQVKACQFNFPARWSLRKWGVFWLVMGILTWLLAVYFDMTRKGTREPTDSGNPLARQNAMPNIFGMATSITCFSPDIIRTMWPPCCLRFMVCVPCFKKCSLKFLVLLYAKTICCFKMLLTKTPTSKALQRLDNTSSVISCSSLLSSWSPGVELQSSKMFEPSKWFKMKV